MLTARQEKILTLIVKEYVKTGNIVPLKDFINNYKELHPYN